MLSPYVIYHACSMSIVLPSHFLYSFLYILLSIFTKDVHSSYFMLLVFADLTHECLIIKLVGLFFLYVFPLYLSKCLIARLC